MAQADMKGDCVLVWDSYMDPLLDWSLLLGMLMGLSGIPLGMMLSVDNVQNLKQRLFHTCLGGRLWTQASVCPCGFTSGSECASLVEQP